MKQVLPILILLISISAFAQPDGKMKERIKAQKIAFITEKLNLSTDEAEKFWPVYNEFEAATEKVRNQGRDIKRQMRTNPDMSAAEADALLDKFTKAESDMHVAKIKLVNDLKEVIPSIKIIKLKAAEDSFNRKLLERLKEYREKKGNRN
ncbi:Spy/CpxP family protein refolding chaperone [Psychroserpens jangbogonensis]|uniref:Spy/CpxP family protein refolding chaperone n=1 Tax=Psychroserpens jangbogonensis TaxID=1484460 RepID=UPI00053F0970|nr:hypothetical protein [Psychroserpens jangbogonensis]